MSSDFEKLAADLALLAKAQPSEDETVAAAAADAGVALPGDGGDSVPGGEEGAAAGADDDGEEDDVLGKSFSVVGPDGAHVKAYDATELLKSMSARLEAAESALASDEERREHLGKSMTIMHDLLKSQAEQIDRLNKAVIDLGGKGRGRVSVVAITEKPAPAMAKAMQPDGVDGKDFMAKAIDAQRQGRITALDVSIAEGSLNRGIPVREDIVSRVLGKPAA